MLSAATADPFATCSTRSHSLQMLPAEVPKLFNLQSRHSGHCSKSSTLACWALDSGNVSSSSSNSRRRSVIAHDKKPNRNPYLELEKDLLPDGKPNTPWRRLQLKIRSTTSLQGLTRLYLSNRHKSSVWRPIHSAGILMRIAALYYYRIILPPCRTDDRASCSILELLNHIAPDLIDPRVLHVMDAARLAQVLVVLAALNPKPPAEVLDPLVRELMREGFKKLPATKPDLLAELAAALAKLEWREKEVWLAIAAVVKGQLRANKLQREVQQAELESVQLQLQQQQQWSVEQQAAVLQQQQQQWSPEFRLDQQPQGMWQQQQQQQPWQQQQPVQQAVRAEMATFNSQSANSIAVLGERSYNDVSEDYSDNEYELDEEEWYEEDPAYWSLTATAANNSTPTAEPQQQQQQQQQVVVQPLTTQPYSSSSSGGSSTSTNRQGQRQQSTPCLSMCYPRIAAAVAAVGLEDAELMQLLGSEAVHVLPLLTQHELAELTSAYATLSTVHSDLLRAVSLQLQQNAVHMKSSSSRRQQQQQGGKDVAAVIQTAHALGQLGFADVPLLEAVQMTVLSSSTTHSMPGTVMPAGSTISSTSGSPASSTGSTPGPEQYVQVLQLLVQSGCLTSSSSSSSNGGSSSSNSKSRLGPLIRWACTAISASGLEALQPLQLAAAAVALVELQLHPEAAAAAAVVGAAATARAQECGPEVLADVVWCCVTLGCANMVMADITMSVVEQAAEQLQQQQQQQQRQRQQQERIPRKKRTKKGAAQQVPAAAAATGFGLLPGAQQQQQPQLSVLSSRHQAQLVLSLQRMGRVDLAQRAMSACQVVTSTSL